MLLPAGVIVGFYLLAVLMFYLLQIRQGQKPSWKEAFVTPIAVIGVILMLGLIFIMIWDIKPGDDGSLVLPGHD